MSPDAAVSSTLKTILFSFDGQSFQTVLERKLPKLSERECSTYFKDDRENVESFKQLHQWLLKDKHGGERKKKKKSMFLHRSRRLDHEEKENVSHRRTKTSAAGDLPENMMEHTRFQRGVTGYGSDVVVLKDGQDVCAFPMNYFKHLLYFCSLFLVFLWNLMLTNQRKKNYMMGELEFPPQFVTVSQLQ